MCTAPATSSPPYHFPIPLQEKKLKEEARAKIEKRLEGKSVAYHGL